MRSVFFFLVIIPSLCWSQSAPSTSPAESQDCECSAQSTKGNDAGLILGLSERQMHSHVLHVVPLELAEQHMEMRGTVVLRVQFQPDGTVSCARAISGTPLAIAYAMKVVPKWTFRAVERKHKKYGGCGALKIRYDLSDSKRVTSVEP